MIQTVSTELLAKEVAQAIADSINYVLTSKSTCNIALPGGRSAEAVFKELAWHDDLPWANVHVFLVDDRLVPNDDPESNSRLVRDFLSKRIDALPKENIHLFSGDAKDVESYGELLRSMGKIDVFFVSAGEDGHIAGLYPNHHTIKSDEHFFISYDDSPKPPLKRMSASKNLLLRATCAVLVFSGEAKREALNNFKNPHYTIESCPAKIVSELKEQHIFTDMR